MASPMMSRRQFMGTAIVGSAAVVSGPAAAASTFSVGNNPVVALSDGHFIMPSDMFLGTPQTLRDRLGDPVQIAANTFAYRAGERTFLFDAGAGAGAFITQSFPTVSKLPNDLKAAGITADEVTDIVITHMHPDHVGGTAIDGAPAFPHAAIHVAETEWRFWNAEGFASSGPDGMRP